MKYNGNTVALRKESVDRNYLGTNTILSTTVALRKESVDRNLWWGVRKAVGSLSLSARRAWIEIQKLLKSIDKYVSLSARRAWIEIVFCRYPALCVVVALRKESVDRNFHTMQVVIVIMCRSPQGERG